MNKQINQDTPNPISPPQHSGIFVSGLPAYSSKEKLTEIFSQFGEISYVRIFSKKDKNRIKGFAKIKFFTSEQSFRALTTRKKLSYESRTLKISALKTQSKLEKSWSGNKKLAYVHNIPYKTSKAQLLRLLKSEFVPVKKVIRIIKRKIENCIDPFFRIF